MLQGLLKFRLNVPAPNEQVMAYLLERAYQMDPYFCLFMTDRPFGQFDRYIVTAPLLLI